MPKYYENNCKQCSTHYRGRGQLFCGNSCRVTWTNLNRNVAKREDVKLKISKARKGKPTIMGKTHWNWQGKKKILYCEECGAELKTHWGNTPKYCVKCRFKGERSGNWRGGITEDRNTVNYQKLVKYILKRDNYTCQWCNARICAGVKVRLNVHHIKSYVNHPELRFEPTNLITLCRECHLTTIRGVPRVRYAK